MNQTEARRMAEEVELPEPDIHGIDSMAWSEFRVRQAIAAALAKLTQGQEPVVVTADDPFVKLGVLYMKSGRINISDTEFIAWCSRWFGADADESYLAKAVLDLSGLPITSQQEERKPLTNEQLRQMRLDAKSSEDCANEYWFILFARAIEAAHGIGVEK